jgi:hypothetical protein
MGHRVLDTPDAPARPAPVSHAGGVSPASSPISNVFVMLDGGRMARVTHLHLAVAVTIQEGPHGGGTLPDAHQDALVGVGLGPLGCGIM